MTDIKRRITELEKKAGVEKAEPLIVTLVWENGEIVATLLINQDGD